MTTILFTLTMFGLFALCGLVAFLLNKICLPIKWYVRWCENGCKGKIIDYRNVK